MKRNNSKFAAVFQEQPSTPVAKSEPIIIDEHEPEKHSEEMSFSPVIEQKIEVQAKTEPTVKSKGKKSNPDFTQVTAYLTRKTYGKTRSYLWDTGDKRDFSELVEDLLVDYLAGKTV